MGPGDFLKVSYKGREKRLPDGSITYDNKTPLTLMWDARPYVIRPGESAFAPFEAVAIALGDPRSGEAVSSVRDEAGNIFFVLDRATEVRRLRTLYDNQSGDESVIMFAPDASVQDLEGNQVRTVLDDPLGESVIPVQTTLLDRDQLMAQVQRQQRMIEQLAQAQGIDLPSSETPVEGSETGSDASSESSDADPFASLPEG